MSENMNLYQCAQLFAETMKERFDNPGECAIFLAATDGKKLVQLINGDDGLVKRIIAHVSMDTETRNLILEGAITAAQAAKEDEGTVL